MGKSLAYNYGSSSTSTVAEFVQATQNVAGASFCTFHVKDTSNIFGLGTNSWLKGFIYYQNHYNTENSVDGTGFVMKNGTFGSYNVRINGSTSAAYSIVIHSTLTDNDVVNGLLSTSTTAPLSAAQGKRLYEGKANLLVRQYEEFTVSTAANTSKSIGTKTWTKTGYRSLFAVAKLVSLGDEAAINQYWTINTDDAKAILTGYVRNFGTTTHNIVVGADILWIKND